MCLRFSFSREFISQKRSSKDSKADSTDPDIRNGWIFYPEEIEEWRERQVGTYNTCEEENEEDIRRFISIHKLKQYPRFLT